MQFNGVFSKKSEETGIAMAVFVFINAVVSVLKYSLSDMGEIFLMVLSATGLVVSCLAAILLLSWGNYVPYREKKMEKDALSLIFPVFLSTFAVYYLLSLGTSRLWQLIGLGISSYSQLPESLAEKLIYIICYAVVPAIAEELLFRGTLLRQLIPGGEKFAIIVSSLLFSFSHWDLSRVIPVFCVSLVLSLGYIETGDIVVPIILHLLNNITAIAAVWIGQEEGSRASYAFVVTIIIAGIICAALVALKLKGYKRRNIIHEPVIPEEHNGFLLGPEMLIMFCLYVVMMFQTMGIF